MQAVLLMAGKGTRMSKYYDGPKQLLPVNGKPVIEHILDDLPEEIDELVFVVGGPHEQTIRDYFKSGEYNGRSITFVVQEEQLGLAHAFKTAKNLIKGPWVGMVADDIFGSGDVAKLMEYDLAVLASQVTEPEKFGVLVTNKDNDLVRAIEKPKEFVSDLVWNGAMKMNQDFLELEVEPSARGEYETPDVWMKMIQEREAQIKVVEGSLWLPINDKEQLEKAEKILSQS